MFLIHAEVVTYVYFDIKFIYYGNFYVEDLLILLNVT
jgi:hypothetical protein